jgi:hypothetical protein
VNPADEAGFQAAVIEVARLGGWKVAHFRPARTKYGWKTPVAADGAGWPDLACVRGDRAVFAELKSETGKLSDAQADWLDRLRLLPCAEVFVWRPSDWDEVVATLVGKSARAA